jgi:hypothetical protein
MLQRQVMRLEKSKLGSTGFTATVLGIGDLADRSVPLAKGVATIHRAMDFGLNLIDTAPGYEDGFPADVTDTEVGLPSGPVSKFQSWKGRQYFVGYEHCAMLGGSWFNSQGSPRSTEQLFDLYQKVRNYGGNLLQDIGPDTQGQIADKYAEALIELKAKIEPFEASLVKSKH